MYHALNVWVTACDLSRANNVYRTPFTMLRAANSCNFRRENCVIRYNFSHLILSNFPVICENNCQESKGGKIIKKMCGTLIDSFIVY